MVQVQNSRDRTSCKYNYVVSQKKPGHLLRLYINSVNQWILLQRIEKRKKAF